MVVEAEEEVEDEVAEAVEGEPQLFLPSLVPIVIVEMVS